MEVHRPQEKSRVRVAVGLCLENFARAIELCRKVVQLVPDRFESRMGLCRALIEVGNRVRIGSTPGGSKP
jgi:hypothetical protein